MPEIQQRSFATTPGAEATGRAASAGAAPGKQTLVQQLAVPAVQHHAGGEATGDAGNVHAAAARGVATASSALPFASTVQRAFGRHDISAVQAHAGGDAAASAAAMGADAYATGNHVVLGKAADLHTVAHEAAHVVQQRGGLQLKGGVGQAGDAHERHADEVASLVVQGKSAEALLDPYAGGGAGGGAAAGPVQHKLSVGGADQPSAATTWARIRQDPRLHGIEREAEALLGQWVDNAAKYDDPSQVSSNRTYASDELLISALVGEVRSSANLAHEATLATQTIDEGHVNDGLTSVLAKLTAYQVKNSEALPSSEKKGRYGGWAYPRDKMSDAVQNPPGDLKGRIAMIADYALAVKSDPLAKQNWQFRMTAEQGEARPEARGATNANEGSDWVQRGRAHDVPVSAGPSATTAQVLALAELIGCGVEEKTALAWALFALWNDMPLHVSGTHRFHEVMDVAALHGVPYTQFAYSAPPKPEK